MNYYLDPHNSPPLGLSRLRLVDPRKIWAHEALDFTPWLLDNPQVLAETLGIELELTTNEHPVGGYSLDLVGRDLTNDCMLIVENQLATTDHSHLGQLLTYAAGTDAATVIWIATRFREEHRQAVNYLNEIAGDNARFFAIELNVVQIDDSAAAPLFKLVAEPNDWHVLVSATAKATQSSGGRGVLYRAFWEQFLEALHERMPTWSGARKPQSSNWMDLHWLTRGAHFSVSFAQNKRLRAELYIDTGNADDNSQLFNHLEAQREDIEAVFGGKLEWQPLPGKQACRIAAYTDGEVADESSHAHYIEWMIRSLSQLRTAFPISRFPQSQ